MKDLRIWGLLPAHLLMALTLIVPILIIVAVSFSTRGAYGGFEFQFSTEAYRKILFNEGWSGELEFNPQHLYIIARTVVLSAAATLICMALSFPVAYWISLKGSQTRTLLLFMITLPFWVSMIVRVYAWLIILGNNGVIEKVLRAIGLVNDMDTLLFNNGAMLVGMCYSYIPLMILPVYASIEKLDPALIEASHDLYGSRLATLWRVILPLCRPGLGAGAILVFVPCIGTVLEPVLLGGGKILMMGNLIQMQFGGARNWPFGAAVAVVLMCLVMVVLIANGLRASRKAMAEAA